MISGDLKSIYNEFPEGILQAHKTTKCIRYTAQLYFKAFEESPNGI